MRTTPTGALLLLMLTLPTVASTTFAAQPRNIILMIADGCGFNHLRAGSLWRDDADLFSDWTDLPVSLAVSTYAEGGGYDPEQNWVEGPVGAAGHRFGGRHHRADHRSQDDQWAPGGGPPRALRSSRSSRRWNAAEDRPGW